LKLNRTLGERPATASQSLGGHQKEKCPFLFQKESGARKMKRAKSIFLWCGELVEQWRGCLPAEA